MSKRSSITCPTDSGSNFTLNNSGKSIKPRSQFTANSLNDRNGSPKTTKPDNDHRLRKTVLTKLIKEVLVDFPTSKPEKEFLNEHSPRKKALGNLQIDNNELSYTSSKNSSLSKNSLSDCSEKRKKSDGVTDVLIKTFSVTPRKFLPDIRNKTSSHENFSNEFLDHTKPRSINRSSKWVNCNKKESLNSKTVGNVNNCSYGTLNNFLPKIKVFPPITTALVTKSNNESKSTDESQINSRISTYQAGKCVSPIHSNTIRLNTIKHVPRNRYLKNDPNNLIKSNTDSSSIKSIVNSENLSTISSPRQDREWAPAIYSSASISPDVTNSNNASKIKKKPSIKKPESKVIPKSQITIDRIWANRTHFLLTLAKTQSTNCGTKCKIKKLLPKIETTPKCHNVITANTKRLNPKEIKSTAKHSKLIKTKVVPLSTSLRSVKTVTIDEVEITSEVKTDISDSNNKEDSLQLGHRNSKARQRRRLLKKSRNRRTALTLPSSDTSDSSDDFISHARFMHKTEDCIAENSDLSLTNQSKAQTTDELKYESLSVSAKTSNDTNPCTETKQSSTCQTIISYENSILMQPEYTPSKFNQSTIGDFEKSFIHQVLLEPIEEEPEKSNTSLNSKLLPRDYFSDYMKQSDTAVCQPSSSITINDKGELYLPDYISNSTSNYLHSTGSSVSNSISACTSSSQIIVMNDISALDLSKYVNNCTKDCLQPTGSSLSNDTPLSPIIENTENQIFEVAHITSKREFKTDIPIVSSDSCNHNQATDLNTFSKILTKDSNVNDDSNLKIVYTRKNSTSDNIKEIPSNDGLISEQSTDTKQESFEFEKSEAISEENFSTNTLELCEELSACNKVDSNMNQNVALLNLLKDSASFNFNLPNEIPLKHIYYSENDCAYIEPKHCNLYDSKTSLKVNVDFSNSNDKSDTIQFNQNSRWKVLDEPISPTRIECIDKFQPESSSSSSETSDTEKTFNEMRDEELLAILPENVLTDREEKLIEPELHSPIQSKVEVLSPRHAGTDNVITNQDEPRTCLSILEILQPDPHKFNLRYNQENNASSESLEMHSSREKNITIYSDEKLKSISVSTKDTESHNFSAETIQLQISDICSHTSNDSSVTRVDLLYSEVDTKIIEMDSLTTYLEQCQPNDSIFKVDGNEIQQISEPKITTICEVPQMTDSEMIISTQQDDLAEELVSEIKIDLNQSEETLQRNCNHNLSLFTFTGKSSSVPELSIFDNEIVPTTQFTLKLNSESIERKKNDPSIVILQKKCVSNDNNINTNERYSENCSSYSPCLEDSNEIHQRSEPQITTICETRQMTNSEMIIPISQDDLSRPISNDSPAREELISEIKSKLLDGGETLLQNSTHKLLLNTFIGKSSSVPELSIFNKEIVRSTQFTSKIDSKDIERINNDRSVIRPQKTCVANDKDIKTNERHSENCSSESFFSLLINQNNSRYSSTSSSAYGSTESFASSKSSTITSNLTQLNANKCSAKTNHTLSLGSLTNLYEPSSNATPNTNLSSNSTIATLEPLKSFSASKTSSAISLSLTCKTDVLPFYKNIKRKSMKRTYSTVKASYSNKANISIINSSSTVSSENTVRLNFSERKFLYAKSRIRPGKNPTQSLTRLNRIVNKKKCAPRIKSDFTIRSLRRTPKTKSNKSFIKFNVYGDNSAKKSFHIKDSTTAANNSNIIVEKLLCNKTSQTYTINSETHHTINNNDSNNISESTKFSKECKSAKKLWTYDAQSSQRSVTMDDVNNSTRKNLSLESSDQVSPLWLGEGQKTSQMDSETPNDSYDNNDSIDSSKIITNINESSSLNLNLPKCIYDSPTSEHMTNTGEDSPSTPCVVLWTYEPTTMRKSSSSTNIAPCQSEFILKFTAKKIGSQASFHGKNIVMPNQVHPDTSTSRKAIYSPNTEDRSSFNPENQPEEPALLTSIPSSLLRTYQWVTQEASSSTTDSSSRSLISYTKDKCSLANPPIVFHRFLSFPDVESFLMNLPQSSIEVSKLQRQLRQYLNVKASSDISLSSDSEEEDLKAKVTAFRTCDTFASKAMTYLNSPEQNDRLLTKKKKKIKDNETQFYSFNWDKYKDIEMLDESLVMSDCETERTTDNVNSECFCIFNLKHTLSQLFSERKKQFQH